MNWFSDLFKRKNKENKENKYIGTKVTYYSSFRGEKTAKVYENKRGWTFNEHRDWDGKTYGVSIVPADETKKALWADMSDPYAYEIKRRIMSGEKMEELYEEFAAKIASRSKVQEKAPQTPDEAKKKLSEHVEDGKKKAAGETENKAGGRTEGASNAGKGKLNTKFSSGTERNF
ncbi:MAG: hypothetical protein J6N49_04275 [Alphaproteobacteria bacterium]|nr:hypothetical protein [Alphaproteobacteria bacterium]